MKIKNLISLQRVVAKIDNDFNISESDWIPRVAAWCIDALSQMNILPMEIKERKLEVNERLAQYPCKLDMRKLRVFDRNGCEILNANNNNRCCNSESSFRDNKTIDSEIAIIDTNNKTGVNFMQVANIVNPNRNRNFVIQNNYIELNFDTDYIYTKSYEVATYHDDYFDCEVPYIYDDGLLLEALAWYCLFKYLSRGSQHTVYSLKSNNPITNPLLQWNAIRPRAIASVKNKILDDSGWRNFFYNSTFDPRNS